MCIKSDWETNTASRVNNVGLFYYMLGDNHST